ncbi:MAG: spermidine synthase [Thermodesulfobacteriota bacterium]
MHTKKRRLFSAATPPPAVLAFLAGLAGLVLAAMAGPAPAMAGAGRVVYQGDSLYHHIMITEDERGLRYLSFNRAMGDQSVVKPGRPDLLTFAYTKSGFAALAFLDRPAADVLFVGLGGGSMPMYLRLVDPAVQIDIVEIDPQVVEVAQKHLGFTPDPAIRTTVMDGRMHLKRHPKQYDVIFLDAYNDHAVPFHLTTREFLELVKTRLKPGGVVASNVWASEINRYFTAQIKTYQAVFPEVYLLRAGMSANYIFLATEAKGRTSRETAVSRAKALMAGRPWSFDLAGLIEGEYEYYTDRKVAAKALTDDFAPVNLLKHQKASTAGE